MLVLNDRSSIRSQIAAYYRECIRKGIFKDGDQLPPARILAHKLGTAEANVHHAFAALAREGLIIRRPKRGTAVLHQEVLKHVAFYLNSSYCLRGEKFTRPLIACLETELAKHGMDCTVIYDTETGLGKKELKILAEKREVQGVIVRSLEKELSFFSSLEIPFAAISSLRLPNSVYFFGRELARKTVSALKKHKCRRIAVFYPGRERNALPVRQIRDAAAAAGVLIEEEDIYTAERYKKTQFIDKEEFAYNSMNDLWKRKTHPDGIFLISDDLVSGAAMSLYRNHIRVPEDVIFAIHRTVENPVVFPFPAVLVENSIAEMVAHLVKQLQALSVGVRPERKILSVNVRDYTP